MVNMFLFLAVLSADGPVGGGNQALRLHQADVRGDKNFADFSYFFRNYALREEKNRLAAGSLRSQLSRDHTYTLIPGYQ